MPEHVHTGPYDFLFVGVSALVFLNVLRIVAIWLSDRYPSAARALGGLITFGVAAS